jgi:hypothetical protein
MSQPFDAACQLLGQVIGDHMPPGAGFALILFRQPHEHEDRALMSVVTNAEGPLLAQVLRVCLAKVMADECPDGDGPLAA